jgi:hypothetical protein
VKTGDPRDFAVLHQDVLVVHGFVVQPDRQVALQTAHRLLVELVSGFHPYYEILYYTFKGNHPNLSIITCNYQRSFFAPSGQGYFSRNFSKYSIMRGNNYRYDTNTLNDTTLYADSVLIGNFLYKGISAKGRKGPAEDIDNSLIVLYNYQYGMLRIIDNGKTWVRKF